MERVVQGSQTNLSYVPEQQTILFLRLLARNLVSVGSATLLALFGIVAWRMWRAASLSRDQFGTLLCVGVMAMFCFRFLKTLA